MQIKPDKITIYKVSDESGEISVEDITEKPLHKELLHTQDCFVVDGGACGIYVWVGMRCTKEEKYEAFKHAMQFIEDYEYPVWTPITRIMEGNETRHFKSYFDVWPEKKFITNHGHLDLIEKEHSNEFGMKITSMVEDMIDDAKGSIRVWRVEGPYKVSWPREYYGIMYEGDVYIIQYQFPCTDKYIIYIWQGPNSDEMEKENGRKIAQDIDKKLKGKATQIQVVYGKEPKHFLQLFKGKMVILLGGINSENIDENEMQAKEDSTNRNIFEENDNNDDDTDICLYQISGDYVLNTKAVEVKAKASELYSGDVFLLICNQMNYLWKGKHANSFEIDYAEVVADRLSTDGDMVIFKEGYEPPQFWSALGGKTEYNKTETIEKGGYQEPTLYHCSNATGKLKVKQIKPFDQMDLNSDDVMLLDANTEIFIWIGSAANEEEKQHAWKLSTDFITTSGRSIEDTFISQVKQGFETESFISYFTEWDKEKAQAHTTYSHMKKMVRQENLEQNNTKVTINKKRSLTWGEQRVLKRALVNKLK